MVRGIGTIVPGLLAALLLSSGCGSRNVKEREVVVNYSGTHVPEGTAQKAATLNPGTRAVEAPAGRKYLLEKVDDAGVVQLYADGFDRLSLEEKTLVWHLYQAALAGRDIFIQQKHRSGLVVRNLLEEIVTHPEGVDPATLAEIRRYLKLFWINNSPYGAITSRKFVLKCTPDDLTRAALAAQKAGAKLPDVWMDERFGIVERDIGAVIQTLSPLLFDPKFEPMCTAKNPEGGQDIIQASAVNFYEGGVTMKDLEGFAEAYPLNSSIVKNVQNGKVSLVEKPWRAGDVFSGRSPGMYAGEINAIIGHLEAAMAVAPDATRKALQALVKWYRTGREDDRRAFDVAWVADKDSSVDTINGFVEVYLDPRGKKGAWEGIVFYEDPKKATLIKTIALNAKWFEDHMPYDAMYRKPDVTGISARSIDVVIECGDSGPVTPIGINLPNDQEVREKHGSKSVSIANVVEAYDRSATPAAKAEFCWDAAELDRTERLGPLVSDLITNMHEVIGHASGRQAPEKQGDPAQWIKEYYSALEEARADLVALYFLRDPKLQELGLVENVDEASRQGYEQYTRNGGLVQLRRVKEGDQIEEDHMRNRQMVVRWIQANGGGIEEREREGKHFLVVTDPDAWRAAAGRLLALVQKLKSTGDYDGTKQLFDRYGIKFDTKLRDEVVARYAKLDVPSYIGFVMPRLQPVMNGEDIADVAISYPLSLEQQMLEWSGRRQAPAPAASR